VKLSLSASGDDEKNAGRPRLLLVRHGRTAWNAERRFLGRTDLPLDAEGARQAAALGAAWAGRVDRVVSSPLARARGTAAHLGPADIAHGWTEVDHGALEGLTIDEASARYPEFRTAWSKDPGPTRIPGGETLGEACARALVALAAVRPIGTTAVVAHQLVLAAVSASLAGAPLRAWRRFTLEPTGVRLLTWSGASWEICDTPG
jgi:probable phosphoglycerate mutase